MSFTRAISLFAALLCLTCGTVTLIDACCAVAPSGKPIVNADQTVLILWDAEKKTQHFVRQASFRAEAKDFGFLVPTPSMPELDESGAEAFDYLRKLTEPKIVYSRRQRQPQPSMGCGCGAPPRAGVTAAAPPPVRVLNEKRVAGYDSVVLEADSSTALVDWLTERGYEFSPAVQAWAEPYIEQKWKFTALKVAPPDESSEQRTVTASSLRISFQTDRPLFPYREPDSKDAAAALNARHRLLRIYFISDAAYEGELTPFQNWSGRVAWSDQLSTENKTKLLSTLKLPETTGPEKWWLTEFEDQWKYEPAPADVYFAKSDKQIQLHRDPIVVYSTVPWYVDPSALALAILFVLSPALRRLISVVHARARMRPQMSR